MIAAPRVFTGPMWGFRYTNQDAPSTTPGTSVVPGATNAEGSWTQIASGANIANDVWGVLLLVSNGATSATSKMHLLDLGVDPAGGSSYTALFNNLAVGGSSSVTGGNGKHFYFPLFIKSGSSVAVRIQGLAGTAGTVRVMATFYGEPRNPEVVSAGRYCETIGTITNSNGPVITPGNTAAEGSWTSIGTTTKDLWWFQMGVQVDDATANSQVSHWDLAYGTAGSKHVIFQNTILGCPSSAEDWFQPLNMDGFRLVPGGSTLYVRGSTNLVTPDSNYNVTVVGVGG